MRRCYKLPRSWRSDTRSTNALGSDTRRAGVDVRATGSVSAPSRSTLSEMLWSKGSGCITINSDWLHEMGDIYLDARLRRCFSLPIRFILIKAPQQIPFLPYQLNIHKELEPLYLQFPFYATTPLGRRIELSRSAKLA